MSVIVLLKWYCSLGIIVLRGSCPRSDCTNGSLKHSCKWDCCPEPMLLGKLQIALW